jgi:hypothetical protein
MTSKRKGDDTGSDSSMETVSIHPSQSARWVGTRFAVADEELILWYQLVTG